MLCLKQPGISSIQITINFLDQEAIPKFLPLAREQNIGVITRVPLAQGHLTKTVSHTMAEQAARNQYEFEQRRRKIVKFYSLVGNR